jgi:hypothetical protein
VPPVKVTVEAVVATTPPTQVVLGVGVAVTTSPVGIVSTNGAVNVSGVIPALFKVIVRIELPPCVIVAGAKALPTVGKMSAGVFTVNVAMAGPALLPLLVCKTPAASVFSKFPPVGALTPTVTVQEPPAGIVPTVNVTVEVVVVIDPPTQVVLGVGVAVTTTPVGIVSTSAAVNTAAVGPALLNVMIKVELPPALIVAGMKALPIVGMTDAGAVTVKVATAGPALLPLPVTKAPAARELM